MLRTRRLLSSGLAVTSAAASQLLSLFKIRMSMSSRSVNIPPNNLWIQLWIVVGLLPKVELDCFAPLSNILEVLVSNLCRLQAVLGKNFCNSPQLLQMNVEIYLEVRFPSSLFTKYPLV